MKMLVIFHLVRIYMERCNEGKTSLCETPQKMKIFLVLFLEKILEYLIAS